jgi:hypothetical protein
VQDENNKLFAMLSAILGVFLIISGISAGRGSLGERLIKFFGGEMLISELSSTDAIS